MQEGIIAQELSIIGEALTRVAAAIERQAAAAEEGTRVASRVLDHQLRAMQSMAGDSEETPQERRPPIAEIEGTCPTCDGCGQIANDEESTPWRHWQNLPKENQVAIRIGLVRPIDCPDCRPATDGE